MTDLEINARCAEAMGWKNLGPIGVDYENETIPYCKIGANDWWLSPSGHNICGPCYGIPQDFLHDDAQAMALVKKFPIECAQAIMDWSDDWVTDGNANLNRAICECVVKSKDTGKCK
jgi:hypothetical protein